MRVIRRIFLGTVLCVFVSVCYCSDMRAQQQATSPLPTFDVASIREVKEKSDEPIMNFRSEGDAFVARNASLLELIAYAHDTRTDLVSHFPEWVRTTKWDIEAKISDPDAGALATLSTSERRAMLASLLAERFSVQVHHASKIMPVFELVIAPGGEKLKISEIQVSGSDSQDKGLKVGGVRLDDSGKIITYSTPISTFAEGLSRILEKKVIDDTGLKKRYDIRLRWTPDQIRSPVQATGSPNEKEVPELSTAIEEQLGLKLRSAKAPIDTIVVDKVSYPTSN